MYLYVYIVYIQVPSICTIFAFFFGCHVSVSERERYDLREKSACDVALLIFLFTNQKLNHKLLVVPLRLNSLLLMMLQKQCNV